MLSSIAQQRRGPNVVVDVACFRNNGEPTTEYVAQCMPECLPVKLSYYRDRDRFARRGLVRTDQIKGARISHADYVFFGDADNVYPPDFFRKLARALANVPTGKVIYSYKKHHTEPEATQEMISRCIHRTAYVKDAWRRSTVLPKVEKINKRVAAGCMQVVAMDDLKRVGWEYVPEKACRDHHLFERGQKARSDIQFRRRIGGSHCVDLPEHIHLNHARDKEVGHHLEVQR